MDTSNCETEDGSIGNTILIADDDAINRAVLANLFARDFRICEVDDGRQALEAIDREPSAFCAILLDVVMPQMDGLALLAHLRRRGITGEIPVFIITARTDSAMVREAFDLGAIDVIHKPIVSFVAERRINSIIELFRARKRLNLRVGEQQDQLLCQARRIADLNDGMISALSTAIEFRNGEAGDHVQRIRDITVHLLSETELGNGLSAEEIQQIGLAAVMHDVGKIAIPDTILNKPGRLTPEEFEIIKTHTTEGAALLDRIPQLKENAAYRYAYDIARHHHERWDGNGYPDGLKGDEISTWAQVVSIVDVYDALVSPRVYKAPIPHDRAAEMIRNGECGVFNPRLLDIFLSVEAGFRPIYEKEGQNNEQ